MKSTIKELQKYLGEDQRKRIGGVMKKVRRLDPLKITQIEMADILHVDRQHINKVENGKLCASAEELIVYSLLFECPVELFLYGIEESICLDERGRVFGKFLSD